MQTVPVPNPAHHILTDEERKEMARIVRVADKAIGVNYDSPYVTPEQLQKRMVANGVRPEDNIFQRELMKIRYGNDEEARQILVPASRYAGHCPNGRQASCLSC